MDEIGGTGPPPIPAGTGKFHLEIQEPFRLVSMDAAVFDWLWRVVENRHRQHVTQVHGNGTDDIHALQAEVSKRAVIAFREAAGTLDQVQRPTKRRKLVRAPKPG